MFFEINQPRLLHELHKQNEPGIQRVMNWYTLDGWLYIYLYVGSVTYRYMVEYALVPESVRMLLRGEDQVLNCVFESEEVLDEIEEEPEEEVEDDGSNFAY